MDDKKKIMIREIEHWRRSRLLPEHYCDFLLNLYLDQNEPKPERRGPLGLSPSGIKNSNWKIWALGLVSIAVIALTALNFNAFELPMQIGISLLFLAILYGFGGYKRGKEPMSSQILLGMASLFALCIGVYLLNAHGLGAPVPIVGYVFLCSLLWIGTGMLARFVLFQLCGWVSLTFCYGWLLHHQLETLDWATLELSWVPLALLFCWLSWMIHERSRQSALVFFLLSLIVWYMPELYGMLYAEQYGGETVQWMLLGKMVIEAALLFFWRKKWIEWVV
ncbi:MULTISPECIES: hypothetical protein [Paenibacillus]|uniref:hypothetical protein n=1 Tax=Paenibacillus TaxID=44249 RepID=UPI0022B88CF2|nr:hypothetical protein [Paenibacillus caseinilyticus]MCZ8518732.1 hypothetical protein [Paenibacillus caseinilyticus]